MKVDFKNIFHDLIDEYYCIIKLPFEFPRYNEGSDLDILCFDINETSNKIISHIHKLVNSSVIVEVQEGKNKIQIDILENSKIHFRFDLYGKLPSYKNILIKDSLFSSVIENSITIEIENFKIKVPNHIDEAILRYIEFHEFFSSRPDKLKHIEYIEILIKNNSLKIEDFYKKLHYYIDIPLRLEKRKVSKYRFIRYLNYVIGKLKTLINLLYKNGISETIKYTIDKYFK